MFDGTGSATIKGATQAQADKIKDALDKAYTDGNLAERTDLIAIFASARGTTITVGDRPVGKSYEVVNGITLYLNLTCVNGSELQAKLTDAVAKMVTGTPVTE